MCIPLVSEILHGHCEVNVRELIDMTCLSTELLMLQDNAKADG